MASAPSIRAATITSPRWTIRPRPARARPEEGPSASEPAAAGEGLLAEAEELRGDLEQLVVADPLQRLLEVHEARRREANGLVGGRRPHVGELLLLRDVDVEVVVAGVLAHDLALVDRLAGRDEQNAARLQVVDGVRRRLPGTVGDHRAVGAAGNVALPRRVDGEQVGPEAGAS